MTLTPLHAKIKFSRAKMSDRLQQISNHLNSKRDGHPATGVQDLLDERRNASFSAWDLRQLTMGSMAEKMAQNYLKPIKANNVGCGVSDNPKGPISIL